MDPEVAEASFPKKPIELHLNHLQSRSSLIEAPPVDPRHDTAGKPKCPILIR
jgi:hypothetical protein